MHKLTKLPADLADFATAAQRSLEAGDFTGSSERLAECLAAFQAKTRTLDDVEGYRAWLNGSLSLARIAREHLSHQSIQLRQPNYGRSENISLWSVQA